MKRSTFIISFLLIAGQLFAQKPTVSTTSGQMSFFSKAPLEDIEAHNKEVSSEINLAKKEIVAKAVIRQFEFHNKLMQEHFNTHYLESDKFPEATFKGKINEAIDFSKPGVYDVSATGVLNIHGVNQKRTITGKLTIDNNSKFTLESAFEVALKDHRIKIPKLVFGKIAEKVAVKAVFNYLPDNK
ncbi:MAG TPA: YceI family protein [Daejeonella sp.]|nr:YceI family protein [Daejeonella sp.]